jgi:hypothetical protein
LINVYALDGVPRITHIWPYVSLGARAAIPADSVAQGVRPPKNAPEQLFASTSTIGHPTAASPPA